MMCFFVKPTCAELGNGHRECNFTLRSKTFFCFLAFAIYWIHNINAYYIGGKSNVLRSYMYNVHDDLIIGFLIHSHILQSSIQVTRKL